MQYIYLFLLHCNCLLSIERTAGRILVEGKGESTLEFGAGGHGEVLEATMWDGLSGDNLQGHLKMPILPVPGCFPSL